MERGNLFNRSKTPQENFENMVSDWEQQILARNYGQGEIVGDELMELAMGRRNLSWDEMSWAYHIAENRVKVKMDNK